MSNNLISEVSRIREMMGLVLEQEIRTINGKRYEVSTEDDSLKVDFKAEFNPGKYLAQDMSNTVDNEISQIASWLSDPKLKGKKLVVVISAGSSKTPITPGGTVANELQRLGLEPTNASLAQLRANTALELVKNGLSGQIPQDVFDNVEFTTDLSGIEQGPEFDPNVDKATDAKYKGFQKLGAEAFAAGFRETLAELPDICNTSWDGSGDQGKESNKGAESGGGYSYASYPENGGKGMEYDLGLDTEGEVTLTFTAYHIPDMFQITYNGVTHTSSGPGGEGFVSNNFKTCDEGTSCWRRYTKKIARLNKNIKGDSEDVTDAEGEVERLDTIYVNMLKFTHGIETPKRIDREWIIAFFEKFKPGSKSWVGKMFTNKKRMKYNKNFTDGYSKYDKETIKGGPTIDGNPRNRRGKITADIVTGKEVWSAINDIWMELDDNLDSEKKTTAKSTEGYQKEIDKLQKEFDELKAIGSPGEYSKLMTTKLQALGFENGVVGTNGSLKFEKVAGVDKMYLQVFAPLDGTIWGVKVTCKDLGSKVAQR